MNAIQESDPMQYSGDRHPSPEDLESYSMGRLDGPKLAAFEEHLLCCEECQEALALEDAVTQGMRDAGSLLQHRVTPSRTRRFRPAWAFGLGLVTLALLIFGGIEWSSLRRAGLPAATVLLQATRGSENPAAIAPAGRPITLVLDLTDLPQLPQYQLEIVEANGHSVLHAVAGSRDNRLQTIVRGLSKGAYFVRVYSPSGELLREYALTVV